MADSSTATIAAGNLTVTSDNAAANGVATDAVQAKVTDANGNLVPGVAVAFSITTGATVVTASAITDAEGVAKTNLTSEKSGAYTVTAALNEASQTATVNFKADAATAVTTLVSDVTTQAADGTTAIVLTATVKDAKGNLVPNENVVFTTTGSAKLDDTATTKTVATGADGVAKLNLTDEIVETVTVTARSSSNSSDAGASLELMFKIAVLPVPGATKLLVNGASFGINEGFPKTGFAGASFQIALNGDTTTNDEYNWTIDSTAASVDSAGNVEINSESGDKITVTAAQKVGGKHYTYTFQLTKWFINGGAEKVPRDDRMAWCASKGSEYFVPSITTLTNALENTSAKRDGSSGQIWPEWGNMSVFGHGWQTEFYWASENYSGDPTHGSLLLAISTGERNRGGDPYLITCQKNL